MLNNKLNAHGSFTPAAVAPPNAITPEQVLRHHRSKRRGGMGGQALSPPSSYQCSAFHIIVKEFYRAEYRVMDLFRSDLKRLNFNLFHSLPTRFLLVAQARLIAEPAVLVRGSGIDPFRTDRGYYGFDSFCECPDSFLGRDLSACPRTIEILGTIFSLQRTKNHIFFQPDFNQSKPLCT